MNKKRTRLISATTAAIFALSLAIGISSTASAVEENDPPPYCPLGYACLYEDTGYMTDGHQDWEYKFAYRQPDLRRALYYYWKYANDNATGVYNHGRFDGARFYEHINFGGLYVYRSKTTGDQNLTDSIPIVSGWNDRISSVCFTSYC